MTKAKKPAVMAPTREQTIELRAEQLLNVVEEMVGSGAMRLPYAGILEAIVDLKRALKQ